MDQQEPTDKITGARAAGEAPTGPAPAELAKYIDHTMLKPDARDGAFDQLCEEAVQWGFHSVCVNSSRVRYVAPKLRGTDVKVCAVVGFPLGAMETTAKAFEGGRAVEDGAHELDMVMNVGALKSGSVKFVEDDIRAVREAAGSTTVLKVIIETSLLSDDEKVLACRLAKKAGADFVKTCTGFGGGGATPHDIALMRRAVGPEMGVKASGGLRNYPRAVQILAAGATRIGATSSVAIVTGQEGQGGYTADQF